jgi:tetratricopeptide (TPR) repeat protein
MMHINSKSDEGKIQREKYHVMGVPTVILFSGDGSEIDRIVGYDTRDEWMKEILGYAFEVGTLSDLKKRADEKQSGALCYKVAGKYYERGSYDDAVSYIEKARKDASNSSELKGGIDLLEGECLLAKDPGKGKAVLMSICLGENKDNGDAAFDDLVRYYRKQKDDAGVVDIYKKMLPKRAEDTDFLNSYAWTFSEMGKEMDSALEVAVKAAELSKNDPQILDTLAEVYFKMGKKSLAVETIEKAIAKEPDDEYYKEQKKKFLEK